MTTLRIAPPRNALISYHYLQKFDVSKLAGLNLIGDSGAFSAKTQGATIDVNALCDWSIKWKDYLVWTAALDVIGDPVGTHRNWLLMRGRGVNAVPTIHFPAKPTELDDYAKDGVTFLGLGGQVGGNQKALLRWVVSVMRYARDKYPDMRFHGWGATGALSNLLPYYSVDSTSWASSFMFGRLELRDPRSMDKRFKFKLDGKEAFKPEIANLLSSFYGVSPSVIARSHKDNAEEIIELSALSASVWQDRLRKKHGVITVPPDLKHTPLGDGPHLHLANGRIKALMHLAKFARSGGWTTDAPSEKKDGIIVDTTTTERGQNPCALSQEP